MPDGLIFRDRNGVLMTTDAVGGVWRYTLDLARGFAARGIPVTVAVLGPEPDPAQRGEASGLALIETGLALDWTAADPASLAATTTALRALARQVGAGSVHLHAPALAGPARWAMPVVAVAHSCVATWWRAVRGGALPADFHWRTAATRAGLVAADAVIAPSQAHARAIQSVYGDVAVEAVHNGIARSAAEPGETERAVLTAGRLWDEGKNAAALDRVATLLDAPIRAAGPLCGPNGASIALPNLHHLGTLDRDGMDAAYAGATVFASLARYEPFGLSVLEAASAGMRLVLSDIPSFRELWDGAATFVADEASLLAALQQALAQQGDGGARDRALAYTLDATVERTLAIHRRVGAPV